MKCDEKSIESHSRNMTQTNIQVEFLSNLGGNKDFFEEKNNNFCLLKKKLIPGLRLRRRLGWSISLITHNLQILHKIANWQGLYNWQWAHPHKAGRHTISEARAGSACRVLLGG